MNTQREYKAFCGESLVMVCWSAIKIASAESMPVWFDFNGIKVEVAPESTITELEKQYDDKMNQARLEYEKTPKHAERKKKREDEIERKQKGTQILLNSLDSAIQGGRHEILDWLYEFTDLADDICVHFNPYEIFVKLLEAGYESGYGVNRPADWYTKDNSAMYIIGQAMSFLKDGMPLHPVTRHFIEQNRNNQA